EVSEWLIEQPWKGCVGLVLTAGSNPALSVGLKARPQLRQGRGLERIGIGAVFCCVMLFGAGLRLLRSLVGLVR
ncbi:MAG: hypothetical protein JXB29_13215, partial [Sedimentisphaerales bacterium]|nr:hypothetical protein [Sedimentisphaerales bacterium]